MDIDTDETSADVAKDPSHPVPFGPSFNDLPPEVMAYVFSFLPRRDWMAVMLTSRLWKQVGERVLLPDVEDLQWACDYGKPDAVRRILANKKLDIAGELNVATLLNDIIQNNFVEVMWELLKDDRIDPSLRDNATIGDACASGRLEMVKLLLKHPKVNPSTEDNWAIRCALDYGHDEIVKELLRDGRLDWRKGPEARLSVTHKKKLNKLMREL